jgi:predicted AAA+ superfamily ATPase
MQTAELGADYRQQNPWWETEDVSVSKRYHSERRSDYQYKYERIQNYRFVDIAGAAGSGKTTILHQIAHDLLADDGIPAQNVMYLPLGDSRFQIGSNVISDAVEEFATYYWNRESDGFVLIDDAHAASTWSHQVRDCLDKHDNLTIGVTLPSLNRADTAPIEELDIETASDLLLPPKFYDVVTEAQDIDIEKPTAKGVRKALARAVDEGDIQSLREAIDKVESAIGSPTPIKRGVIEFFSGKRREDSTDDVRRNLELSVYRDIPRYQQFEDRSDLHALCAVAAMHPGQTLGLKDLSDVLNCDRRTLQRYIDILEDFFILTPSYQYAYERRRSVKLYLRDPLMVGALTDADLSGLLEPTDERRFTTAVIFDHLKRLGFFYHRNNAPISFWESAGESVDFVVETGEGTPIPLVTTPEPGDREPKSQIEAFCEEHECDFGVKIERDVEPAVADGVATLPLWLFLLIV